MSIYRDSIKDAAEEILHQGWQPVPLHPRSKKPIYSEWQTTEYTEQDLDLFSGDRNLGVKLGPGGLVEVDLDDSYALDAGLYLLPQTPAVSGRVSAPRSHFWYLVDDPPRTTRWKTGKDPVGTTLVELRGVGGQTVVPSSVHPSGELYEWWNSEHGGNPFGLAAGGPARVDRDGLLADVQLVAIVSRLAGSWPGEGGRHDAYLALAGALMKDGDGLDQIWDATQTDLLVTVLAKVVQDEEWRSRSKETVLSTVRRLEQGQTTHGWPTLANLIGENTVADVRRWEGDYRKTVGAPARRGVEDWSNTRIEVVDSPAAQDDDRSTWAPVDLKAVSDAGITRPDVTMLMREDGPGLLYPGRLSMLVGASESGKTWLALHTALQVVEQGGAVVYVDMEDTADGFLWRLQQMGVGYADVEASLSYVSPDEQISPLQFDRWGTKSLTENGVRAHFDFQALIKQACPSLVIVDGLTALMSLHGLNSNDAVQVEHVGRWLRTLSTGESKPAVLLLDHTGKGSERGAEPVGSQHKKSMVSGVLLQTWVVSQIAPGAYGRVEVCVIKDRPGEVRRVSTPGDVSVCARMVVDSTGTASADTVVRVIAPDGDWGEVPQTAVIDLTNLKPPKPKVSPAVGSDGPGVLEKAVVSTLAASGRWAMSTLQDALERNPQIGRVSVEELAGVLRSLEMAGQVMKSYNDLGEPYWSRVPM